MSKCKDFNPAYPTDMKWVSETNNVHKVHQIHCRVCDHRFVSLYHTAPCPACARQGKSLGTPAYQDRDPTTRLGNNGCAEIYPGWEGSGHICYKTIGDN